MEVDDTRPPAFDVGSEARDRDERHVLLRERALTARAAAAETRSRSRELRLLAAIWKRRKAGT